MFGLGTLGKLKLRKPCAGLCEEDEMKKRYALFDGYISKAEGNFFTYQNGWELCLDLENVGREFPPGKYRLVLERLPSKR